MSLATTAGIVRLRPHSIALALAFGTLPACQMPASQQNPSVGFGSAPQVGAWQGTSAAPDVGGGPAQSGPMGTAGTPGLGMVGVAGAGGPGLGSAGMGAAAGRTGGLAGNGMTGSGGRVAGSGGFGGLAGTGVGSAGTGTVGAAGMSGQGMNTGATVEFSVLTHSQGGRFSPRNIGAIWIEDGSGKFVKTLAVWAATRARYLSKFNSEAGGNRTDAVTSATLGNHVTHDVKWNLHDVMGNAAPNGAYKVLVEVTDYDGTGKFTEVDFTYNGMPMTVSPPDTQYFTAMKLTM